MSATFGRLNGVSVADGLARLEVLRRGRRRRRGAPGPARAAAGREHQRGRGDERPEGSRPCSPHGSPSSSRRPRRWRRSCLRRRRTRPAAATGADLRRYAQPGPRACALRSGRTTVRGTSRRGSARRLGPVLRAGQRSGGQRSGPDAGPRVRAGGAHEQRDRLEQRQRRDLRPQQLLDGRTGRPPRCCRPGRRAVRRAAAAAPTSRWWAPTGAGAGRWGSPGRRSRSPTRGRWRRRRRRCAGGPRGRR